MRLLFAALPRLTVSQESYFTLCSRISGHECYHSISQNVIDIAEQYYRYRRMLSISQLVGQVVSQIFHSFLLPKTSMPRRRRNPAFGKWTTGWCMYNRVKPMDAASGQWMTGKPEIGLGHVESWKRMSFSVSEIAWFSLLSFRFGPAVSHCLVSFAGLVHLDSQFSLFSSVGLGFVFALDSHFVLHCFIAQFLWTRRCIGRPCYLHQFAFCLASSMLSVFRGDVTRRALFCLDG